MTETNSMNQPLGERGGRGGKKEKKKKKNKVVLFPPKINATFIQIQFRFFLLLLFLFSRPTLDPEYNYTYIFYR
jgi:hypothetical protein